MTPCLTPEEFVDLVDGTLASARAAHLETCAACRVTAREVREALDLATAAPVPEPSEFFWPGLNARVRAAITESSPGWRAWFRWDVVVPMAGLALVVMALASAVDVFSPADRAEEADRATLARAADPDLPGVPAGDGAEPGAGAGAGVDDASDGALAMMVDLAESLPEGGWDALGVSRLPDLDVAAASLSDDERRALADLLQSAVERPKS